MKNKKNVALYSVIAFAIILIVCIIGFEYGESLGKVMAN